MDFKEVRLVPAKDPTTFQRYRKAILTAIFVGVVVLVCFVIGILHYTSPKQRIIRAINSSDYEKASEIQEKNNITLDEKYDSVLNAKLSEVNSNFANGKIDFENAISEIDIIKSIGGDNVASFADLKKNEIISINDSKIAFSKGMEFHDKGDFASAIKSFKAVAASDIENYTKAQQMIKDDADSYRTAIFNTVDSKVSENKHEEALSLLIEASDIIPNDKQISNKISAIRKTINDQVVDSILAQAETSSKENLLASIQLLQNELPKQNNDTRLNDKLEEYKGMYLDSIMKQVQDSIDRKDYDGALTLLKQADSELPSTQTILNKIQDINNTLQDIERAEKIAKVLKEAENIYNNQGYEQAMSYLNSSEYSSSREIQGAIANYESHKPVSVKDLPWIGEYNVGDDGNYTNNLGETFEDSLRFYAGSWGRSDGSIEFRVGKEYNTISGIVTPVDHGYWSDWCEIDVSYIVIIADDREIGHVEINYKSGAVPFKFDISNAEYVKIELRPHDLHDEKYIGGVGCVDLLVANLFVQK